MRASANLSVKGTLYYKAFELYQNDSLSSNIPIRLEHQPNNPHDRNAVAIRVKHTGEMLGHVSRDIAPKYAELINKNKIIEAKIFSVSKKGTYINIIIQVLYELSDDHLAKRRNSRMGRSVSNIPATSGLYVIRNIDSGKQYVGSSINLKSRTQEHINHLSSGNHENYALQSDYSRLGPDQFEVAMLERSVEPCQLAKREADQIATLLNAGNQLYNLTKDGQGLGRKPREYQRTEPVSDQRTQKKIDRQKPT